MLRPFSFRVTLLIEKQIVQLLIERGCQYAARNNEGCTPSDYAYSCVLFFIPSEAEISFSASGSISARLCRRLQGHSTSSTRGHAGYLRRRLREEQNGVVLIPFLLPRLSISEEVASPACAVAQEAVGRRRLTTVEIWTVFRPAGRTMDRTRVHYNHRALNHCRHPRTLCLRQISRVLPVPSRSSDFLLIRLPPSAFQQARHLHFHQSRTACVSRTQVQWRNT